MTTRYLFLLSLLLGVRLVHADTLYKCTDDSGVVLYTNQKGSAKNCTVLSRDQPVSTYSAPKQAPHGASPSEFPRVDGDTQRGRDSDRRRILEKELATEQQNLEQAKNELTQGEAIRLGNEKNYQKYLDRVQPLKENVELHERNIEAIKREIANIR